MDLDHVTVRTDRLEDTIAFYRDLIGLKPGYRPNFSFAGAWLYHGTRPVVHLRSPGAGDLAGGGVDHVAFRTDDFDGVMRQLNATNTPYRETILPDGTARQVFVQDPNRVTVEITGT